MRLEILQDGLVHDQHRPALDTRPHAPGPYTSEPPGHPFSSVYDLQPFEHRLRIQCHGPMGSEGRRRPSGRDTPLRRNGQGNLLRLTRVVGLRLLTGGDDRGVEMGLYTRLDHIQRAGDDAR